MNDILHNINESERGGLIDLGKALRELLARLGGSPPPGGGSGNQGGWAHFETEEALALLNPILDAGESGYETDTFRWKLGDGVLAWNDLPYQDTPLTPPQILNPGATITFDFAPLATQVIEFTTIADTTTFVSELQIPTNPPAVGHEGIMFVRVINTSLGTLNLQVTNFNIFGDTFDGLLATNEAIEFSLWVLNEDFYVEGGPSEIPPGGLVENADLAEVATGTIKGRLTAGTGVVEDLTVLQVKNSILTTASVTNALLSNIDSGIIKGRYTAGTGAVENLTPTQVKWLTDFAPPNSVALAVDTTLTKAAHQGRYLVCTAAVSLTVDVTTDFDQHCLTTIRAEGGAVTIVATATVNSSSGLIIPQYATGVLRRMTSDDIYSLEIATHPKVTGANSVAATTASGTTTLALSGDVASPGNNQVYGTGAGGVRGWKADPAGGGASALAGLTDVADDITGVEGHVLTYTTGAWRNGVYVPPGGSGTAVDSLADLTAIASPAADQIVTVLGHTTPGDQGGGIFIWDAAETDNKMISVATVAAGGTGYAVGHLIWVAGGTHNVDQALVRVATITGSSVATVTIVYAGKYSVTPSNAAATTSDVGTGCTLTLTWVSHTDYGALLPKDAGGVGRWNRVRDGSGRISVKAFGAVGDGVTDDWQAMQRAIWTTKPLHLPIGNYKVNKALTWFGNETLDIRGDGKAGWGCSSIDAGYNTDEPVLHKFGRYMTSDGTYAFETGYEVSGGNLGGVEEKLVLRDMRVRSTTSIYGSCCELTLSKQSFISNVMFDCAFRGLTMGQSSFDTTILNCEFDSTFMNNFPWADTTGAEANNIIAKRAWGLYLSGHCFVYGTSIVGCGCGLRMSGIGNVFNGARLEVNNYGIIVSASAYNMGQVDVASSSRSSLDGISLEANTIAMRIESMTTTGISNFGIQGSVASGVRPEGEIGLHIISSSQTSTISNGVASGTFSQGALVSESRHGLTGFTATGNVVAYAKTNSVFGQTGSTNPAYYLTNYTTERGSLTAFSNLMQKGLTGLNLRDGLVKANNLGDVVTPASAATSTAVTFPGTRSAATYGFNVVSTPANGASTLSTGTYCYGTTVVGKTGETGVNTATTLAYRSVAVTAGQAVQLTFFGGTVASLKRRVYRTKVNSNGTNFEGYWEQSNTGTTFTDINTLAFTARGMPPVNGDIITCVEPDTNYQIVATPSWNTSIWVTSKATTGFTLNFGTAAPDALQTVSWLMFRP